MARFFRLPVVPSNKVDTDDWLVSTDTVADVKRIKSTVFLIRKGIADLTLNFENEDQAKDFLSKNFLIFNA